MNYPEDYINKIICGDCLEFMKGIPDKAVDLVLTDPPYGINMDIAMKKAANTCYGKSATKNKDYGVSDWDSTIPSPEVFKEIMRVSKEQIIFGGNYFTEYLKPTKAWYVWDKKCEDKYSNDFGDCEMIWTSFDKPSRMIRFLWHGMIQENMGHKEARFHPTQKPCEIIRRLLLAHTTKDSIVFDPFLGSGTTAVACKELGRNFIGIEINKKYCEIAKRRLAQEYLFT